MAEVTITSVTVPNLQTGQAAFQLDGADTIVVEITQKEIASDPHNVVSVPHVCIQSRAWKINPDGTVAKDLQGVTMEIPVRFDTIVESALAEGTVNLENKLVEYSLAACQRAANWLIVKATLNRIPVAQ